MENLTVYDWCCMATDFVYISVLDENRNEIALYDGKNSIDDDIMEKEVIYADIEYGKLILIINN